MTVEISKTYECDTSIKMRTDHRDASATLTSGQTCSVGTGKVKAVTGVSSVVVDETFAACLEVQVHLLWFF